MVLFTIGAYISSGTGAFVLKWTSALGNTSSHLTLAVPVKT